MLSVVLLNTVVATILFNIFQNGKVEETDKLPPVFEILGKEPNMATVEDILKLTKKEVFRLFQQLPIPDPSDVSGDFQAINLPQAVLSPLVQLITDRFFGPGRWVGKGFDSESKKGYNLFEKDNGNLIKDRYFDVFSGSSEIDTRPSLHLDYRELNSGFIVGSMRDEIRVIHPQLLLGMGKTTWGLGPINPAHFILLREDLSQH